MKHTFLSALAAAAAIFAAGCSDISENDRYILTEGIEPQRAVLIEDFTGQNCLNCPNAHETIEKLAEQYGDAVIPVSIHAGALAYAVDDFFNTVIYGTCLKQPEGDTYNDEWGIVAWPQGVINRTGGARNHDDWAGAVRTEMTKAAPVDITVSASCPAGASDVAISVSLAPLENIDGKLQLWILEDGITAVQRMPDGKNNTEYVHNHVYRASVNGVGGERIVLAEGIHTDLDYSIELRDNQYESWVPENLSVVAFVYTADDGVLQAAKARVSTTE